jgi:hypothetical protein
MAVPLSDHLLIKLRRSAVRTRPGLEQRPVAVRFDGSDAGRKTAAAYAAVTSWAGFAEKLRSDADAAWAVGASDTATVTSTLREVGEQIAGEVQAARQEAAAAAGKGGGGGSAHSNYNSWTKRLFTARKLRDAGGDPRSHMRDGLFHPATGLRKTLSQAIGEGKSSQEVWDAV